MRALRTSIRTPRLRAANILSYRPVLRPILRSTVSPRRLYSTEQKAKEEPKEESKTEEEQEQKKYHREDTSGRPPPDPNKSPFQVFVDTFKSELAKSQELQETVKALQDESGRIGDSEALRRAKEAYSKARVDTGVQPR
jgi:hypothetical protein